MLITILKDGAHIAGSVWKKGTRVQCPDPAAKRAIAAGDAADADAAPAPAKKKAPAKKAAAKKSSSGIGLAKSASASTPAKK